MWNACNTPPKWRLLLHAVLLATGPFAIIQINQILERWPPVLLTIARKENTFGTCYYMRGLARKTNIACYWNVMAIKGGLRSTFFVANVLYPNPTDASRNWLTCFHLLNLLAHNNLFTCCWLRAIAKVKADKVPMKRRVCYKIARLPQCLWMICCRWVGSCQTIWRQTYFTMLAMKTNISTELNICTKTNTVSDHGCGLGKYLTSANLLIEKARSTGIPICIASSGFVERFRPCYHIIIVGCIDSTQQWFTMI